MWKAYSAEFIRRNRASGISVMAAAGIASLFLSLLCCLFFNSWSYEVERITREEGEWQGRLTGMVREETLPLIEQFANVETAEINRDLSRGRTAVVDITFQNMRTIYRDMPLIAQKAGLSEQEITYHETLLSRYLIHDPEDENPPLLLSFCLAVLGTVSCSLVLIIHNAFAVSMDARIHQFGIFSSIGATPRQIRVCLIQEAAALCLVPIGLGNLLGIAFSAGILQAINVLSEGFSGRHESVFRYHPLAFLGTVLISAATVLVSAWLPARKLSRLTPLEAIRTGQGDGERRQKMKGPGKEKGTLLAFLFGVEGKLAGNALRVQRKALRTSDLSLTFSFLGFTTMLCFFTLSGISTNHTYFQRYQDVWDVMVTVKDTRIEEFGKSEEIRALPGVESSVVYQKASAVCVVPENGISQEVLRLGGLETIAGDAVAKGETGSMGGGYYVHAPVVVMDDSGFAEYCTQIGAAPDLSGGIVVNSIWDSLHSNFRYREYVPFLDEILPELILQKMPQAGSFVSGKEAISAPVPVIAYAKQAPVLREEYEDYSLVFVLPVSFWNRISGQIGNAQEDTFVRVLAENRETEMELAQMELARMEQGILNLLKGTYETESENRIQEKTDNDRMIMGYMVLIGAFCMLLAAIGIANVFSNTLGFLRQRRREFARYLSIGMTPDSLKKMFVIETLVIAGRPLLITLPVTAVLAKLLIRASFLDPLEFWTRAPFVPIALFSLSIFGFVGLAYYIGGRRVLRSDLTDALRNDSLVY